MKKCNKCKVIKTNIEFSKHSSCKDGLQIYCKKCVAKDSKKRYKANKRKRIKAAQKWYKEHKDIKRNTDLIRKYGINLDDYNALLINQKYKCAICKKKETVVHHRSKKKMPLAVDHCHKTNKIRGLLCIKCNQLLGKYELLKSEINNYLNNK